MDRQERRHGKANAAQRAAQRAAERRRSHINDPVPEKWTIWNMWVFKKNLPFDWGVIIFTVGLMLFGALMVLSASSYEMGSTGSGDAMSEFATQVTCIIIGCIVFFFAANLDYRWLNQSKLVFIGIAASFISLAIVFLMPRLPFLNNLKLFIWVPKINDAYRWIHIGFKRTIFSIQPTEIVKVAVILYLAYYITHNEKTMHLFFRNNFRALAVVGILVGFIVIQPNLSTASLIVFVTIIMLMVGGMRWRTFFMLVALGVAALIALAYITPGRWERITSFTKPWTEENIRGDGYQLVQSYYALGNGGWFGTTLGLSKQKHLFLPYAYSDFIYAIVGEELGWVGGCTVLLAFLALIWFGLRIAINAYDKFGCYLALGLTSILAIQVILNIFVVTGMMPTTGIPLPFFTAGGTTMVIFLGTMGLLVSVSRRPAPKKEGVVPPKVHEVSRRIYKNQDR